MKAVLCPVLFPCRSVLDLMHPALHTFGELAVSRKLPWLFRLRLVGQKSYKTFHIPYPLDSTLSPSSGPVVETDIDTKLQAWLTVIRSSGTFFSQAAPQSVCAHNQLLLNSGLSGLFPSILHSLLVEAFTSYEAKTMTILQGSGSGSRSKNSWSTGSFLLEYILATS